MTAEACSAVGVAEGYGAWAATYDEEPNALLHLEQRYLAPLLPAQGDIADLGCGTGRWLNHFSGSAAGKLYGIDASPQMLELANRKLRGRATLIGGDCTRLSLPERCADVVLSSFVAGYLPDLDRFAAAVDRIARDSADVFITDMHPQTAVRLGWKRTFGHGERRMEFTWRPWSLYELLTAFRRHGFEPACILEPRFSESERPIFENSGKPQLFAAASADPAIYIAQLRRTSRQRRGHSIVLRAGRVAWAAHEATPGSLRIEDGRVAAIMPESYASARPSVIELGDCMVLPGLINAHDHLEFALFPRLGKGPYRNAEQWARDIHRPDADPIARHRSVPAAARVWWGGIRNLLCGATTVCHHNPLLREMLRPGFPVRVVKNFAWAHSLAFDRSVREKFAATAPGAPFLLHLGEGIDESSRREIFALSKQGALGPQSVLIHGLALDDRGIALLNQCGAALVWCPSSNQFLFGTHPPASRIAGVGRVALGTDSPLTAAGDLLDEVRFAREVVGVPAPDLYQQVSRGSADVLALPAGSGSVRPGTPADFVAVRDTGASPCERLCELTYRDVELVLLAGRVHLASDEMRRRLPPSLTAVLRPLRVDGVLRWVRAPLGRLFAAAAPLGSDLRLGGRRVEHVSSAWK